MAEPEYCTLKKAQRLEKELAEARAERDAYKHQADELAREIVYEWKPELTRLRELEARLPKDKHGKAIVPGDTVICPRGHRQHVGTPQRYMTCKHDGCYIRDPGNKHQARYSISDCEAAQHAREEAHDGPE